MIQRYLDGKVIWWTGKGPFGMTLSSYALRHGDTTVWIDAVDPGRDLDAVLELGPPAHLLITFGDHDRDVLPLARRFGAEVWIPDGEAPAFRKPDHVFGDGMALPAGLKALALPGVGYGETLLYGEVDDQRIGFFGDAVLHLPLNPLQQLLLLPILVPGRGGLQRKRSFRGGDTRQALQSLPKILDLGLDAAFFSHGTPLVSGAGKALREAIASW